LLAHSLVTLAQSILPHITEDLRRRGGGQLEFEDAEKTFQMMEKFPV
jgi:hypothetical protein